MTKKGPEVNMEAPQGEKPTGRTVINILGGDTATTETVVPDHIICSLFNSLFFNPCCLGFLAFAYSVKGPEDGGRRDRGAELCEHRQLPQHLGHDPGHPDYRRAHHSPESVPRSLQCEDVGPAEWRGRLVTAKQVPPRPHPHPRRPRRGTHPFLHPAPVHTPVSS